MFSLFSTPSISGKIKYSPKLNHIYDLLRANVEKIKAYHKEYGKPTPSSHTFVKILNQINWLDSDDLLDVYGHIRQQEGDIAMAQGIFSSLSKGKVFTNNLFKGSNLLILDKSESVSEIMQGDLEKILRLSPVKVVRLGITNGPYNVPLELSDVKSAENDITVCSINVAVLGTMFYAWAVERKRLEMSYSPQLFIGQVVFPNMLESISDSYVVNRISDALMGVDIPVVREYNSTVWINDISVELQDLLADYIPFMGKSFGIFETLSYFNLPFAKDINSFIPDLEDLTNSSNVGAELVGIIAIANIVSLSIQDSSSSTDFTNKLAILKRMVNGNGVLRSLPRDVRQQIKEDFREIESRH